MDNLLQTLLNAPISSVFALQCESNMTILVSYSTSLIASLLRIIEESKTGNSKRGRALGDMSQYTLVILETSDCRNKLRLRTGFYMNHYKNLGYTLLDDRVPAQFKVKMVDNLVSKYRTRSSVSLYLVSRRNTKILVGAFRTRKECNEFIGKYYPDEYAYDIIYSDNELSKNLQIGVKTEDRV